MRVVYFAWLRERIGAAEEDIELPSSVRTVGDAIRHLAGIDDVHAQAFAEPTAVRAALDRRVAEPTAAIGSATEIAFFPPMTGG